MVDMRTGSDNVTFVADLWIAAAARTTMNLTVLAIV